MLFRFFENFLRSPLKKKEQTRNLLTFVLKIIKDALKIYMIAIFLHQSIRQIAMWHMFAKYFMYSLCLENISNSRKRHMNLVRTLIVTLYWKNILAFFQIFQNFFFRRQQISNINLQVPKLHGNPIKTRSYIAAPTCFVKPLL